MNTTKAFYDFTLRYPDQRSGLVHEIAFGLYAIDEYKDASITGEVMMNWHDLGYRQWSPRLDAFADGWAALDESGIIPDLMKFGAENDSFSPDEFKAFLVGHGFEDWTLKGR